MSIEPYTDAPEAASYSNESLDKGVKRNPVTRTPEMSVKNFARTYETPKEGTYQKMMSSLGVFFGCLGTVPFLCCQNPYVNVNQGEVGLVGRFGALSRAVEPGSTYVNTWVEKIRKVSIRNQSKEVPSQDCLTRDNVSVNISSVIYYNIVDCLLVFPANNFLVTQTSLLVAIYTQHYSIYNMKLSNLSILV